MEDLFTPKAKEVLMLAQEEAKYFKHQTIGSEHLLLALVVEQEGIAGKTLREMNIQENDIREEIEHYTGFGMVKHYPDNYFLPYSPRVKQIIAYANDEAKRSGAEKIGTEHLLLGLLRDEEILASRIMLNLGLSLSRMRQLLKKKMGQEPTRNQMQTPNRRKQPTQAKQETMEGTPTLDALARDLTRQAIEQRLDPVVGRNKEVRRLVQILSRRTKNNPVLVGEPGVGKTAIVEGLAQRIIHGQVPEDMLHKRVMMLDMGSLVAGTKFRGEFEERLKKIIDEIYNDGHIILFIDEIHTLIGAGSAEGSVDASNILKPALARGEIQLIGATTLNEYQKYIEKDSALERRLAKVQVDEPSQEEAVQILQGLRPRYEEHHGLRISDEAIEAAVTMSVRYIHSRQLPDKAIDLIDESAAKVRLDASNKPSKVADLQNELVRVNAEKEEAIYNQSFEQAAQLRLEERKIAEKLAQAQQKQIENQELQVVSAEDVAEVVSQWTGVPVQQIAKKESQRLMDLEKILHQRVVGQDKAVVAVSRAIRRARSGCLGRLC